MKKYGSITKKKKKKHDEIVNSYISLGELVSVNNVLREYYEMKEEVKNPKTSAEYTISKQ